MQEVLDHLHIMLVSHERLRFMQSVRSCGCNTVTSRLASNGIMGDRFGSEGLVRTLLMLLLQVHVTVPFGGGDFCFIYICTMTLKCTHNENKRHRTETKLPFPTSCDIWHFSRPKRLLQHLGPSVCGFLTKKIITCHGNVLKQNVLTKYLAYKHIINANTKNIYMKLRFVPSPDPGHVRFISHRMHIVLQICCLLSHKPHVCFVISGLNQQKLEKSQNEINTRKPMAQESQNVWIRCNWECFMTFTVLEHDSFLCNFHHKPVLIYHKPFITHLKISSWQIIRRQDPVTFLTLKIFQFLLTAYHCPTNKNIIYIKAYFTYKITNITKSRYTHIHGVSGEDIV
jgi:hypothetical protein